MAICVLTSCVSNRVNLVDDKYLNILTDAPKNVIVQSSAYKEDEGFVVSGRISKGTLSTRSIGGHLDILIETPNAEVFAKLQADLRRMPAARRAGNPASFFLKLPALPPSGSKIHLTYHTVDHD